LTYTPVKNALKIKPTTHVLEQLKKQGPRREEINACATFPVTDTQKKHRKTSRNGRMQATQKKKPPRILYACTVLTHILEVRPQKCRVSAYNASCGHTKNALKTVTTLFAQIASQKYRNAFV
jgi:hypothetical protein